MKILQGFQNEQLDRKYFITRLQKLEYFTCLRKCKMQKILWVFIYTNINGFHIFSGYFAHSIKI